MNFISTFDELSKLYEDVDKNAKNTQVEESDPADDTTIEIIDEEREQCDEGVTGTLIGGGAGGIAGGATGKTVGKAVGNAAGSAVGATIGGIVGGPKGAVVGGIAGNIVGGEAGKAVGKAVGTVAGATSGAIAGNKLQDKISSKKEGLIVDTVRGAVKGLLGEDTDAEIELVDDEPKQTIIECSKCGALVIVDEVEVDEESDLVNVKDECKFCEEKEGFKIIGSVLPYEEPEADDEAAEADEFDDDTIEEPVGDELAEEDDIIEEDIADVVRKTFDKPASIKTQQRWEDELNGEMGEISDERRAHLEKKFAQQRDWEARHSDKRD